MGNDNRRTTKLHIREEYYFSTPLYLCYWRNNSYEIILSDGNEPVKTGKYHT